MKRVSERAEFIAAIREKERTTHSSYQMQLRARLRSMHEISIMASL